MHLTKDEIIVAIKDSLFRPSDLDIQYIKLAMDKYAAQEIKIYANWLSNHVIADQSAEKLLADYQKAKFRLKKEWNIPTDVTMYECWDCVENGIDHRIEDKHAGHTDERSYWGPGLPITNRVCTGCGRWDGGWISAEFVKGY